MPPFPYLPSWNICHLWGSFLGQLSGQAVILSAAQLQTLKDLPLQLHTSYEIMLTYTKRVLINQQEERKSLSSYGLH